jgi:hypothetical protein
LAEPLRRKRHHQEFRHPEIALALLVGDELAFVGIVFTGKHEIMKKAEESVWVARTTCCLGARSAQEAICHRKRPTFGRFMRVAPTGARQYG